MFSSNMFSTSMIISDENISKFIASTSRTSHYYLFTDE